MHIQNTKLITPQIEQKNQVVKQSPFTAKPISTSGQHAT